MCNAFSMLLRMLLSIIGVQESVLGCSGGPSFLQNGAAWREVEGGLEGLLLVPFQP